MEVEGWDGMGWTGRNTGTLLMWWSIYLSTCEGAMQTHLSICRKRYVGGAIHQQGDMRIYLARSRKESICNIWIATESWSSLEMYC